MASIPAMLLRPSRRDSRLANFMPARCGKWLRPTPAVQAISAMTAARLSSDARDAELSSSQDRYSPARSRSAPSDLPDRGSKRVRRSSDAWSAEPGVDADAGRGDPANNARSSFTAVPPFAFP